MPRLKRGMTALSVVSIFKTSLSILAALDARVLHQSRTPEIIRGRREGRVPTAPMARQQQKKLAAVTTGLAEQPAFPAQWF